MPQGSNRPRQSRKDARVAREATVVRDFRSLAKVVRGDVDEVKAGTPSSAANDSACPAEMVLLPLDPGAKDIKNKARSNPATYDADKEVLTFKPCLTCNKPIPKGYYGSYSDGTREGGGTCSLSCDKKYNEEMKPRYL